MYCMRALESAKETVYIHVHRLLTYSLLWDLDKPLSELRCPLTLITDCVNASESPSLYLCTLDLQLVAISCATSFGCDSA